MKNQVLSLILTIVTLCGLFGCTKQKKVDLIEFCERYNASFSENQISETDFLIKSVDEHKENSYFLTTQDQKLILLTATADKDGTIIGISLTATRENNEFSENYFKELLDFYVKAVSIITITNFDTAFANVIECGIILDNIKFEDYNFKTELDNFEYGIFANSDIVSMYCEKKSK